MQLRAISFTMIIPFGLISESRIQSMAAVESVAGWQLDVTPYYYYIYELNYIKHYPRGWRVSSLRYSACSRGALRRLYFALLFASSREVSRLCFLFVRSVCPLVFRISLPATARKQHILAPITLGRNSLQLAATHHTL